MKIKYIIYALIAVVLYAISVPFEKILLGGIGPTLLAGYLYFGAGLGMMVFFLFKKNKIKKEEMLSKDDIPHTIAMVILDIIAPILLLYGLKDINAGGVSLLGSFEIVATSLIAFIIFKEKISLRIWFAIILITISCLLLSVDDIASLSFSKGSLFVILATICWGFENNCTRKISSKNTFQIVMIKGLCCGIGSLTIGFILNETIANSLYVLCAIVLGFLSFGLSIYFYIKAQSGLGAAKTSAFYAINPFIGTLLSLILFDEILKWNYYVGLLVAICGTVLIVIDTLKNSSSDKDFKSD